MEHLTVQLMIEQGLTRKCRSNLSRIQEGKNITVADIVRRGTPLVFGNAFNAATKYSVKWRDQGLPIL